MSQPEPNRDSQAFLSALADQLCLPPDAITAKRHITAAASTARATPRRSVTTRWTAAAIALTTLLGTGGIAVAGGLPAPAQTVAADVARALPLPVRVPYPTLALQTDPPDRRSDPPRDSAGETETEPRSAPVTTTASPPPDPPESVREEAGIGREIDKEMVRGFDRCELGELRDRGEDGDELRSRIRRLCGLEFVDPPEFTTDDGWAGDKPEGGGEAEDGGHVERDDGDREQRDRDRDGRSWGSGSWEGSQDSAHDQEEQAGD